MRELEKKAKEEAAEGGTPHSVASPQSSLGHHNNSVNHNNSSHTPHTGEQNKSINLKTDLGERSGEEYKTVFQ